MQDEPCLSILLLTEDRADHECVTLAALVHKMLHLVDGQYRKNLIDFQPQNPRAREAMLGNIWKSAKPEDRPKLVDLGRAIATKLLEREDEPGFVLFHFDGDCAWTKRKRDCENVTKFEAFVVRFVEHIVDAGLANHATAANTGGKKKKSLGHADTTAAKAKAMSRLLRFTPFYSKEAWLFQNTVEARRLCQKNKCGKSKHLEQIDRWATNRDKLDDVLKIKDALPCIRDRDYPHLATTNFPHHEAESPGTSYAETVVRLRACPDLCAALARTRT